MDELDLKWEHMETGIRAQAAYLRADAGRALYALTG